MKNRPVLTNKIALIFFCLLITSMCLSCVSTGTGDTLQIQILATSDTHGKFLPYSYLTDSVSKEGSLAQVCTAVKQLRTNNTVVVDVGDIIQGNYADVFFDQDIHPMILAQNEIGYDLWTTGNHEYNFGIPTLKKIISQNKAVLVCGNVRDEGGKLIGKPYVVINKGGVKIAFIGMVSPLITSWDKENTQGYTVTDPVQETQAIIKQIKGKVDLIVAFEHMTLDNELEVANTGVKDLAMACPDLDLIIAAHGHQPIDNCVINGVPIIENKHEANTLGQIIFNLKKTSDGWKLVDTYTKLLYMKDYEQDESLSKKLEPYHQFALKEINKVIGKLDVDYLAKPNEIRQIPTAQVEDTALLDFINEVMQYYAKSDVSATALMDLHSNSLRGDFKAKDVVNIYKHANTLYKLKMNGKQLKKWMEWSASYFNTFKEGDLTVSFDNNSAYYLYDAFSGVSYDINVSKQPGCRIENLRWPDGNPVKDDDVFTVAANSYRATSGLTKYGTIFKEGEELPQIIEKNIGEKTGGIRELIRDYIVNVKKGSFAPACDNNWKLTGIRWNQNLRDKLVRLSREGKITIEGSSSDKVPNTKPITEQEIRNF